MARLVTSGFEIGFGPTSSQLGGDGVAGASAATISTTKKRTGAQALKADSGAGNVASTGQNYYLDAAASRASGVGYYSRAYYLFDNLPGSTVKIMVNSSVVSARLTSAGKLQLFDDTGNAQIGSDSSATIAADGATWYRVEMLCNVNSAGNDTFELYLDGTLVATGTAAYTNTLVTALLQYGWINAPGANKVCYVDDVAINDSSGASQNSYPGSGKVVLLKPTADSAGGAGWTLGTGTALGGNGFAAVDNTPPTGVADLAVGSDPKQIRNASANANSNMDVTMQTYTVAGLVSGDTVTVIQPFVYTAAPVTTAAKTGTVGVVSNPTIANISLLTGLSTAGVFWGGATAGTYPAGWKPSYGTSTYSPSVTLGTAPVMRITQVTSSTRIAMVCFMGMYVEYTPLVAAVYVPRSPGVDSGFGHF